MDSQLAIDIFIAFNILLALTRKYVRIGLFMLILGFVAQIIFNYWVNHDPLIGFFSVIALIGALYEFIKSIRNKGYHLDKRTRLIISSVIIILGAWHTSLGTVSPFLVTGIVAFVFIALEKRKLA